MLATAPERVIERAIVVGGAGFIGSHLVRVLVESGVEVTSIDRDPRGRLDGSGAHSIQADIALGDLALTAQLAEEPVDVVFLAVGTGFVPRSLEHPWADLESNVGTVLAVLETLRQHASPPIPVIVHCSSVAVYGEARHVPMTEQHPTEPLSPYGVSKLSAERYLRLYSVIHSYPTLSLRLFSVFGPGQRKLVVHDLAERLLSGEAPLIIEGSPDVTRDYVYVGDVARCAHRLAAAAPARGEAYNVCSGVGTPLSALAEHLRELCGSRAEIHFTGTLRTGDPVRFVGDPSKAAALGARCRSDLESGLRETVAWLRQRRTARS